MSRIDYWREVLDGVDRTNKELTKRRRIIEQYDQREQKLEDWFEENAPELIDENQTPAEAAIELLNFYVKGPTDGRS